MTTELQLDGQLYSLELLLRMRKLISTKQTYKVEKAGVENFKVTGRKRYRHSNEVCEKNSSLCFFEIKIGSTNYDHITPIEFVNAYATDGES